MTYVYDINVDTICCLFLCVDVAPRGCKVELQRASACQETERLPQGERHRNEDAVVGPTNPERETRRNWFDDPGVGPSQSPLAAVEVDFEDIRHRLEAVL
jgi:hypothetical protein